jgi:KaiC/GvpD/RAD55 family RecA-like ATPase
MKPLKNEAKTLDPKKLGYVCLSEFLSKDLPPPRSIIAPWLLEGEVTLLHADAGVGKTWFALTLALIASKRVECFGYVGAGVPVLYVDGEMGKHDLHGRMTKLCSVLKADPASGEPFHLLARSLAHEDHLARFPDLCSEEGQDLICSIAKQMNAGLVVLDNYRTLATLEDENDATAFQKLNRFLKRLARDRAVIGVHHNNKHSKMSGSTALETVLSHRFNLAKDRPSVAGQACFSLRLEKNRTGLGGDTVVPLKCELGADGWTWSHDNEAQLEEFRAEAEACKFVSQLEAAERFGVADRTIRNWSQALEAAGLWPRGKWRELTRIAASMRAAMANEAAVEPEAPHEVDDWGTAANNDF